MPRVVLYLSSALTLWPLGWLCRSLQRKYHLLPLPLTFRVDHGLPIMWDEDEPGDWACLGVVGPKSVIKAAAAELAAKLDAVYGRSVEPQVPVVSLKHGLAIVCYSGDLLSTLEQLDRTSRTAEVGLSDLIFECHTLYTWIRGASKDSTIVHVRAFSHGENYFGNSAAVWREGEIIWGPWRDASFFDVIDVALRFLATEDAPAPATPNTTTFGSESRIHETAAHGRVLEFVLTGAIPHERWDSAELAQRASNELKNEIARHQPKAVIINLLEFDHSFGNEIVSVFLSPYMTLADSGGGKIGILAAGETAASLDNLLKTSSLDAMFGRTHRDLGSALAQITEIPTSAARD